MNREAEGYTGGAEMGDRWPRRSVNNQVMPLRDRFIYWLAMTLLGKRRGLVFNATIYAPVSFPVKQRGKWLVVCENIFRAEP